MSRPLTGKSTVSWRELQEQTAPSSWPSTILDWTVSPASRTQRSAFQEGFFIIIFFFFLHILNHISFCLNSVNPSLIRVSSSRQVLLLDALQPWGHAGDHPSFALLSRWSAWAKWGSQNAANWVSIQCYWQQPTPQPQPPSQCLATAWRLQLHISQSLVWDIGLVVGEYPDGYVGPPGIPTPPWTSCPKPCLLF